MNKIIEKKIWPEYFDKVQSGEKTFEYRLADFDCNVGDTLILKEWDPKVKKYTGRTLEKVVTYIRNTKELDDFWPDENVEKYGYYLISIK